LPVPTAVAPPIDVVDVRKHVLKSMQDDREGLFILVLKEPILIFDKVTGLYSIFSYEL
jgi:hypothetical protein